MLYESKRKVSAVRFNGDNINEVRRLLGQQLLYGKVLRIVQQWYSTSGYTVEIGGEYTSVKVGEYLVKENKNLEIMSAEKFEATFKPSFPIEIEDECEQYVIERACMFIEEFYNDKSESEVTKFKLRLLNEIDLTRLDNGHSL